MNGFKLGLVFGFLKKHRRLRSASGVGQRLKKNESELAAFWELESTTQEQIFMDHFLQAQGFSLKRYDSFDMPGIPKDAYTYLLLRDGDGALTPWADAEALIEQCRIKVNGKPELKDETRAWVALLWLNLLQLQYPMVGRGLSEVSRYQESFVSKDKLAESMKEAVRAEREKDIEESSPARSYILDSASPSINTRVNRFVSYLSGIGHLEEFGNEKGVFQQTLLAAAEIGVNYDDGLLLLLPHDEDDELELGGNKIFAQMEHAFELAEQGEMAHEQEL